MSKKTRIVIGFNSDEYSNLQRQAQVEARSLVELVRCRALTPESEIFDEMVRWVRESSTHANAAIDKTVASCAKSEAEAPLREAEIVADVRRAWPPERITEFVEGLFPDKLSHGIMPG